MTAPALQSGLPASAAPHRGGEVGALIRSTDWTETPLGPRETWSLALRTVLDLVIESGFPMAVLWGPDLVVLYNDACRAIAKDKHPGALGRPVRHVAPEIWPEHERIFAAVGRGETVFLEDAVFPLDRHGAREEAYFTVSYSPVRDERGSVAGALVTMIETTQRVREQQSLAARHQRFSDLSMDMLAIASTRDGHWQHVNPAMTRTLGWSEAELLAMPFYEIVHPDDLDASRRGTARLALGEPLLHLEHRVRTKDGGYRWIAWNTAADIEEGLLYCVGRDITDRRRDEDALRASERRLGLALDAAQAGVWEFDLATRENTWDSRIPVMLGLDPREGAERGSRWLDFVHPDDRPRLEACFREAIDGGGPLMSVEFRVQRPDGATRWFASRGMCVQRPDGSAKILGVVQDITERKESERALLEANERLREADRHKNQFLAVLSHELRNPLAPIRNSVHLLERAAPGGEQARRALQVIDRQAQHMSRLVEDLLDVTRISRGKIMLQRERIELNALARGAAEDHKELFARSGVELVVEESGEPLYVDGDPTRLAQIIGNLLNNSVKFTPRGGTTRLSVEGGARGEVVVRVRDDGVGITPDTLAHLFEPFVQADQALDRTRGGLGLGLALVKALVEMHGGAVTARSEGEGRGAELTVTLPLASRPTPEARPARALERAPHARRVLVVEDNVDAAETLRELLELGRHEVAVAFSGPEGIEAARAFRPDVVLCDIGLPGLDGYAVARAVRADPELRSCFLVALSGYALEEDVSKSRAAGFDRHVAKPARLEALDELLAGLPSRSANA